MERRRGDEQAMKLRMRSLKQLRQMEEAGEPYGTKQRTEKRRKKAISRDALMWLQRGGGKQQG